MALLAEEIVEEWLNRNCWFTIRGIRIGVNEIDLLAIKLIDGKLHCRHIEVQASINPVSYITPLPRSVQIENGYAPNNARKRPPEVLEESVRYWIDKKFNHPQKIALMKNICNDDWSKELAVLQVKFPEELKVIESHGVKIYRIQDIVNDLKEKTPISRSAGADLVDLILFQAKLKANL